MFRFFGLKSYGMLAFQVALMVKNPPVNAGDARDVGSIPGLGRPSRVASGNLLQFLAWQIPWTEEPGRLWAMGSQRVGHDLAARHTCTYSGSSLPSQGWKPHSLHRKVESAAELPGKSQ